MPTLLEMMAESGFELPPEEEKKTTLADLMAESGFELPESEPEQPQSEAISVPIDTAGLQTPSSNLPSLPVSASGVVGTPGLELPKPPTVGDEIANVALSGIEGVGGAANSFLGILSRPFSGDVADNINHMKDAIRQVRKDAQKDSKVPELALDAVSGAAESIAKAIPLGLAGGMPGVIIGFGIDTANQSITIANDAGMTPSERNKFVFMETLIEMGITLIGSGLAKFVPGLAGLGGAEDLVTQKAIKEVIKGGFGKALQMAGIRSAAELTEENVISILSKMHTAVALDEDRPEFTDLPAMYQWLKDTVIETSVTTLFTLGGLGGARTVARAAGSGASRRRVAEILNEEQGTDFNRDTLPEGARTPEERRQIVDEYEAKQGEVDVPGLEGVPSETVDTAAPEPDIEPRRPAEQPEPVIEADEDAGDGSPALPEARSEPISPEPVPEPPVTPKQAEKPPEKPVAESEGEVDEQATLIDTSLAPESDVDPFAADVEALDTPEFEASSVPEIEGLTPKQVKSVGQSAIDSFVLNGGTAPTPVIIRDMNTNLTKTLEGVSDADLETIIESATGTTRAAQDAEQAAEQLEAPVVQEAVPRPEGEALPEAPVEAEAAPDLIQETLDTDPTEPAPEGFSSRQEEIRAERGRLGIDEPHSPTTQSWFDANEQARDQKLSQGALALAEEMIAEPRSLNDVETAGLNQRRSQLITSYETSKAELANLTDDAEISSKSTELNRIESEYETVTSAQILVGTEQGRALASRKATIDDSLDILSVVTRAKAAKGKSLTGKERKKIETLVGQLEKANAKLAKVETELADQTANQHMKDNSKSKRLSKMTDSQKQSEQDRLAKKLTKLLEEGCNS